MNMREIGVCQHILEKAYVLGISMKINLIQCKSIGMKFFRRKEKRKSCLFSVLTSSLFVFCLAVPIACSFFTVFHVPIEFAGDGSLVLLSYMKEKKIKT